MLDKLNDESVSSDEFLEKNILISKMSSTGWPFSDLDGQCWIVKTEHVPLQSKNGHAGISYLGT